MLSYGISALIAVIGAAIAGFICFQLGVSHRRKTAEAKIGSAEDEAKRLINDAIKTAEQKRKEALLEAKDEIFKMKAESDKELKERRGEISRQERRLNQKEENLDKKTENLEQKELEAKQKAELIEARLAEMDEEADVIVTFENAHNDVPNGGTGIVNRFEATENGWHLERDDQGQDTRPQA